MSVSKTVSIAAILFIVILLLFLYNTITKPSHTKESMKITSAAFENNQKIPEKYTCSGENINPPLRFLEIAPQTRSLVLIMDDPDAPSATFVHWVVYNIDPTVKEIGQNSTPSGKEGINSAGKASYMGPCPPSGTHHYVFTLYALGAVLDIEEHPTKEKVTEAMKNSIIDSATLTGMYGK